MRRSDIPAALADPTSWPDVDASALSGERRETYLRREQAVSAYMRGESRIDIEDRFGVNRASLTQLVGRCWSPHQDGRIQGLLALIPHTRAKVYRRVQRAGRRASRGGLSGALGQPFERFPQLARIVERKIGSGALGLSKTNRIFGLSDVHSKIIGACREAKRTARDYPLNHDQISAATYCDRTGATATRSLTDRGNRTKVSHRAPPRSIGLFETGSAVFDDQGCTHRGRTPSPDRDGRG